MNKEQIKQVILSALGPLDPEKVVLFGSYATNTEHCDSDVDLYIVSREDYIPSNYAENMKHYRKYSNPLKQLKQQVPLDLIIHTRAMNKEFESQGSSFARDIMLHGERLI